MKKNNSTKRRNQECHNQQHVQPDKVGWIRKFCGKGIFREIWKHRFVILRGDQMYISDKEVKEVKEEHRAQEVVHLTDYQRCEELRRTKSRSKKNHSKFTLTRCGEPGQVRNLVFLAVSPEEKESWISALNVAITRAKNSVLDEVMVEDDSQLCHLTRDRPKIPQNRRLPTRAHLLAVASTSSSDGMLTLDLIQEDSGVSLPDGPARSKTDAALSARTAAAEDSGRSQSLPREPTAVAVRGMPQPAAMSPAAGAAEPICSLQELIDHKLQRTQQLLTEARGGGGGGGGSGGGSAEGARAEAERLLREAAAAWGQARDLLEEVKELRALYCQLDPSPRLSSPGPKTPSGSTKHSVYRKSLM